MRKEERPEVQQKVERPQRYNASEVGFGGNTLCLGRDYTIFLAVK
jgi:hypothetical protein